jgi:hypothetical protein
MSGTRPREKPFLCLGGTANKESNGAEVPPQERCISSNVSASFAEDRNPERTAFAFKSLSLIILVAAQFRNGLM